MTDPKLTYNLPPADHKQTVSQETENFRHLPHVVRLSPKQETCSSQAASLKDLSEGKEKHSHYICDSSSKVSLQHEPCSKADSMSAPKDKVNRLEENVCQATKNDTKVFQVLTQQRRHTADMEHSYGCDSVQTDFSLLVLNSVNINGRDLGSEPQQLQSQLSEAPHYDNLFRSAQTVQAHTQSLCLPTQALPSSSHKAQQLLLHSSSTISNSAPTLADHAAFNQNMHHSPASSKTDHDLNQLKIQHNLESKIKQLNMALVLQPESVSRPGPDKGTPASSQQVENTQEVLHPTSASQNQDTSETAGIQIQITDVHSLSISCSFYDNDDDHFLPSLQSLDNADPPPSITEGFHTNHIKTSHFPTHNVDDVLFRSQTFPPHGMEQYLLYDDELPQFSNIPTDTNDMISCTDTMHLTPTIPPNAVHFDWQHHWFDHTPKKDTSKDISRGLPTATVTSSSKEEAMDQARQLSSGVKVSVPVLYVPTTTESSTVKQEKQVTFLSHYFSYSTHILCSLSETANIFLTLYSPLNMVCSLIYILALKKV